LISFYSSEEDLSFQQNVRNKRICAFCYDYSEKYDRLLVIFSNLNWKCLHIFADCFFNTEQTGVMHSAQKEEIA